MLIRAAAAGKGSKVWALTRFWISIHSLKKQLVKKIGVEYLALPGSNLLWRPCGPVLYIELGMYNFAYYHKNKSACVHTVVHKYI